MSHKAHERQVIFFGCQHVPLAKIAGLSGIRSPGWGVGLRMRMHEIKFHLSPCRSKGKSVRSFAAIQTAVTDVLGSYPSISIPPGNRMVITATVAEPGDKRWMSKKSAYVIASSDSNRCRTGTTVTSIPPKRCFTALPGPAVTSRFSPFG